MEVQKEGVEAFHALEEIKYSVAVPYALAAALKLRIPDILAAAGSGASLTAQQIADKLPRKSHDAASKLGRLLRLLAHKGVFAATSTGSETEPRYGLTNMSKYLVTGSKFDLGPYLLIAPDTSDYTALNYLREVVEDDAHAWKLAFGVDSYYTSISSNPDYDAGFNAAMWSFSKLQNHIIAHNYRGFKDIKCLVDVGGSKGGALDLIVSVHPHICGVNFDLPHIISNAPVIAGVEHISGDFFESIPSGDAMLLQHVLHNWSDEECIRIVKNCHHALSENGKLLIQENVVDPARSSYAKTSVALGSDITMMCLFKGASERTASEYKRLLATAGFSHVSFLSMQGLDFIECIKK